MSTDLTVDYLIIGAGSAGCVLANRLSAHPDVRIALLEAGGEDKDRSLHIPAGMRSLLRDPRYNWLFKTEADPGLNGRSLLWPRGKVLGGSSSINGMVYIRGQHTDFDRWAAEGARGWSWQELLPYFRKHEDQARGEDEWHGVGGPIATGDRPDRHPLWDALIAAADRLGIPYNPDFNGARQEGVGYFQSTIRKGLRCSAAVGYLRPARQRPNLRVFTNALAVRILFEGSKAVGVLYRYQGKERRLFAAREVLLAAGAINSPQLLLASGVGPAADLQALGIPVVRHAPEVGENLQDHLQLRQVYRLKQPEVSFNGIYHSWRGKLGAVAEYLWRRQGPMAYPTAQAALFLKSAPEVSDPDIQYHFNNFSIHPETGEVDEFPGMTLGSCQLRPKSRGTIRLRSPDPANAPLIFPNYLAREEDQRLAIESIKLTRRLAAQPSFAHFIEREERPGSQAVRDEDLLAFARDRGTTLFHPVGTCRMGEDEKSVVDPELRVRGISCLRVVDASVMPSLISGNTNAATYVIGEKAADMILTA
jgi:choline dehydrogenase